MFIFRAADTTFSRLSHGSTCHFNANGTINAEPRVRCVNRSGSSVSLSNALCPRVAGNVISLSRLQSVTTANGACTLVGNGNCCCNVYCVASVDRARARLLRSNDTHGVNFDLSLGLTSSDRHRRMTVLSRSEANTWRNVVRARSEERQSRSTD